MLGPDDLPLAELCAARLDGDVSALHGAFIPIDEPDLPGLRANAVAPDADTSLILERRSAAWVHGAVGLPPHTPQLCRSSAARSTVHPGPQHVRELRLAADEIVQFDGVRCTSRARTAFDLLRDPDEPCDEIARIVAHLIELDRGLACALRARLDRSARVPFRALARSRLDRAIALAQPSETR